MVNVKFHYVKYLAHLRWWGSIHCEFSLKIVIDFLFNFCPKKVKAKHALNNEINRLQLIKQFSIIFRRELYNLFSEQLEGALLRV